jgi:hypothetical protein
MGLENVSLIVDLQQSVALRRSCRSCKCRQSLKDCSGWIDRQVNRSDSFTVPSSAGVRCAGPIQGGWFMPTRSEPPQNQTKTPCSIAAITS